MRFLKPNTVPESVKAEELEKKQATITSYC